MPARRESRQSLGIIILIVLLIAAIFMGADIIYLSLRPLKYLGIAYPPILAYTHIIAPIAAASLWIILGRRWPKSSALAAYVLCMMTISTVARCTDDQVDKVKTTTWLNSNDITPLETRLGCKIWETANSQDTELYITKIPAHAAALIAETKRMGIFRP